MPMDELYRRQVALLISAIPLVAQENCLALKGGTAINLFLRDMPRLSVDIDLTYLPVKGRKESLAEIDAAMRRIMDRIRGDIRGAEVIPVQSAENKAVTRLFVRANNVQIKIEITPVLRGCVFEPELRSVTRKVEDTFGFAEIQVVSFPDLYAGKIVAALDRQHPRDFFDVRDLLANGAITDDLRKAFIVYLLSHNRPFSEVLQPPRHDIGQEFVRGFNGMTEVPVTVEQLNEARESLIAKIVGEMPEDHRRFLISVKSGKPDWDLLGVRGADTLPAVRWRLDNLAKLDQAKREHMLGRLRNILGVID